MGYPPVHQLLAVWMSGSEEEHLKKAAGVFKRIYRAAQPAEETGDHRTDCSVY